MIRRTVAGLVPLGVLVASLLGGAASAGAQTTEPISDYASYPAPLPAGCPEGPDALTGLLVENGRGGSASSFERLDITNGDTVTMSWDGYAPGCPPGTPEPVISMAVYATQSATFDPSLDQELLPGWTSCGPGAAPCERVGERYQLSVAVPGIDVTCMVQMGAILGRPLAVVGPSGSFYNSAMRRDGGPNMLIGAKNFETVPCEPAPPTTAAAPTTTAPVAPTVAQQPAVEAVQATTPTTAGAGVLAAGAARELPATGQSEAPLALAATLLGSGLLTVLGAKRLARRQADPTT